MSCFVVSPKHIAALMLGICHRDFTDNKMTFFVKHQRYILSKDEIGSALYQMNIKAYNDRYNESSPLICVPPVGVTFDIINLPAVKLLCLLDGLEYQLSDSNDYDGSLAQAIVNRLRKIFIRSVPGYEDAPWSL
jgi:hypothetical protein